MTSQNDDLSIEIEAAPVVPLHHLASLEVLSHDASAAVRQLQAEERQHLLGDHPSSASALLDIASSLIEHGVFEQHGTFINGLIAKSAQDFLQTIRETSRRKKKRDPWAFWTVARDRHLLELHDKAAKEADPKDLDSRSFYPRLRDPLEIIRDFLKTEDYRNKKGKTINDYISDDPQKHAKLEKERTAFKDLAHRAVDRRLRALLFTRQSLALTDHLFGDLLGDSLGHLRPDV
ncbi:hypothetical protein [Rhizobium sp. KDH_Rht_773_N]